MATRILIGESESVLTGLLYKEPDRIISHSPLEKCTGISLGIFHFRYQISVTCICHIFQQQKKINSFIYFLFFYQLDVLKTFLKIVLESFR